MSGWITNGVPNITTTTGLEQSSFDTLAVGGANPLTGSINLQQLSLLLAYYSTRLDKTMVASTRYTSTVSVGAPATVTGVAVEVGTTGGTDSWIVELHSPTGVVLATSTLSGTTAGTASTFQQIAFTAPYTVTVPGVYSVCLISNGTTAKFASLNVPATSGVLTASSSGTFGTSASITPPTTYTANLGPKVVLYT